MRGNRELEQQLEDAVTLAEEAARKRRELEARLVAAEARAESLAAQQASSRSQDDRCGLNSILYQGSTLQLHASNVFGPYSMFMWLHE